MLRGGVDEECERNKEAYVYMLEMESTNHDKAVGEEANKIDGDDVHSSYPGSDDLESSSARR